MGRKIYLRQKMLGNIADISTLGSQAAILRENQFSTTPKLIQLHLLTV